MSKSIVESRDLQRFVTPFRRPSTGTAPQQGLCQISVSIDVDTLTHYHFLAPGGVVEHDPVLSRTMPQLLDLLEELGIRATLFVIGDTVSAHRSLWRRAAAAGHELASHSHTHVQAFHKLSADTKRQEMAQSKAEIEQTIGQPVVGFRAPAYNIDLEALELLVETGYQYDSSLFPAWYVPVGKLILWARSTERDAAAMSPLYGRHWRLPNRPFRWQLRSGGLTEFPLATTHWGVPFMGTCHTFMPDWFFELAVRSLAGLDRPIVYELHPLEALGGEAVVRSPWVRRVPGVGRRPDPLGFLRHRLTRLKEVGELLPLRDLCVRRGETVSPRH